MWYVTFILFIATFVALVILKETNLGIFLVMMTILTELDFMKNQELSRGKK